MADARVPHHKAEYLANRILKVKLGGSSAIAVKVLKLRFRSMLACNIRGSCRPYNVATLIGIGIAMK